MSIGQQQEKPQPLIQMNNHSQTTAFLSPPTSPPMSGNSSRLDCAGWQQSEQHSNLSATLSRGQAMTATNSASPNIQNLRIDTHPPYLRPGKEYPQSLGSPIHAFSNGAIPGSRDATARIEASGPTAAELSKLSTSNENSIVSETTSTSTSTSTVGASATTGLTPVSADTDRAGSTPKDDECGLPQSEHEGDDTNDESRKTPIDKRADKRKMKRFRLTHNQTRFLMNEFAHQAHPDAAHRERLAREIPGLSPRQVQVWFQNRRAKLKRLTTDDRERMMKSRALPDDFDMSSALYSPFGAPHPVSGPPLSSPASFNTGFPENGMLRPLVVEGIRRQSEDDSTVSPLSVSSAYTSSFTPPSSGPPSENISPVSTTSERHPFGSFSSSSSSLPLGQRNPFGRSSSFSVNDPYRTQIPRLQSHERLVRSRAESFASPLRTSISYTSATSEPTLSQPVMTVSTYDSRQPATDVASQSLPSSATSQYGIGSFGGQYPGFQASAVARLRPSTSIPSGLQLQSQYRTTRVTLPQTPSGFGYSSAPLAAPSDFRIPQAPRTSSSWSPQVAFPDIYGSTYTPQGMSQSAQQMHDAKPDQATGNGYSQATAQPTEIQASYDDSRTRPFATSMDFGSAT